MSKRLIKDRLNREIHDKLSCSVTKNEDELNKLWEEMKVNNLYKIKFNQILKVLDSRTRRFLIEKEKSTLKEIAPVFSAVITEGKNRKKELEEIRKMDVDFVDDKNKEKNMEMRVASFKNKLKTLKKCEICLSNNVEKYIKLVGFGNKESKFDFRKYEFKEFFNVDYMKNMEKTIK